jgi:hypothetical protein
MCHTIQSLWVVPNILVPYHPTFSQEKRFINQELLLAKDLECEYVGYVIGVSLISLGITEETNENTVKMCKMI